MFSVTSASRTVLFVLGAFCSACGGDSPAAPTPVVQAPPAPVVRTLTFQPAASSPSGAALSIQVASRGHEAGKISIAVMAHGLSNVYKVRGDVRWDPALLEFDAWGEGDWLKQGGALVDWTYFTNDPGEVALFLDRPTSLSAANGTGEVFLFRLRPRAGVTSGTSQVQWNEPAVYDASFRRVSVGGTYGGVITIQ